MESVVTSPAAVPPLVLNLVLSVVHSVVAVALFTRQRRVFPLSGHSFGLVIMLSGTLFLLMVCVSLELFFGMFPCAVTILLGFPLFMLWATVSLARSWRAWFLYGYSGDKLRSTAEHYDRYSWFSRKRHHFSDAHLMVYAFLAMISFQLIVGVPWLVSIKDITLISDEVTLSESCDAEYSATAMMVIMGLSFLVHIFTACKLRHVKDGYHLRRDGLVSAACFLSIFPMRLAIAGLGITRIRIILLCMAHVNLFVVVTWKALRSYCNIVDQYRKAQRRRKLRREQSEAQRRLSVSALRSSLGNLRDVMGDEDLMSEFNEHLRSEFSVENMLFHQRAKAFAQRCLSEKSAWSTEERNREAASIYSQFIARDGELQVNLASHMYKAILVELKDALTDFNIMAFRRKKIVKSARPVSATIFEAASGSVYVLMGSDTFVRFKMKLLRRPSEFTSPKAQASGHVVHDLRKSSRNLTSTLYERERVDSVSPLQVRNDYFPQTPTHVVEYSQTIQSVASSAPPPPPPDNNGAPPPPPPPPSEYYGGYAVNV